MVLYHCLTVFFSAGRKRVRIKIPTRQGKCREKGKTYMNAVIEKMRKDGNPYKIRGNDGHKAVLYDMQPLNDGSYMAVCRYPGGECCHDLEPVRSFFEVIEQ